MKNMKGMKTTLGNFVHTEAAKLVQSVFQFLEHAPTASRTQAAPAGVV